MRGWQQLFRPLALVGSFILLAGTFAFSQAPDGIPRDLARQRAQQIKDVHYELAYNLRPKADSIVGHEELHFVQNTDLQNNDARGIHPEWLDFREGSLSVLTINGHVAPPIIQNGHIELPAKFLKQGENVVEIDFIAPVAPAGKAITRFEDKDDGSEYLYTLFVPMDADMAFPCFDQPDLKGTFKFTITAPLDWNVISNSVGQEVMKQGDGPLGIHRIAFAETRPISTYLFAFAAGPFQKVHDVPGLPGLYVRKSKAQKAEAEAADVQQVTADGIKYLADYFAQPFPFPKYDLVLIPNFAYGGMEHAGATFLREESVLFRAVPTHSAYIGRDILLLHELTHQWFGDLVTMRWFDDLWLKEGFAQYMAYHALNSLMPGENMWKRFFESIKPSAYLIDSTQGTTPIYQDIPNLKDAKSAYGAIVYSKAPGVIKQLAFVVGEDLFRDGLRLYLKEHTYGNAEWNDLVHALERTSKKQLGPWADAWIKKRAMPQVDVAWSCDAKKETAEIQLSQHDVLKEGTLWPIATQILIHGNSGNTIKRFDFATAKSNVIQVHGCPEYIFANDHDYAYGRFLLDSASQKAVMTQLGNVHDLFQRTLLWGSLFTTVREAEMNPRDFIELALRLLPAEQDETLAANTVSRARGALIWFVSDAVRKEIAPRFEDLAYDQMIHSTSKDLRVIWFRNLGATGSAIGLGHIKDILTGKLSVPGVELQELDRWDMVSDLIRFNDPDADKMLDAQKKRDPSGDAQEYLYEAEAGRPDAETKRRYFDEYLHNSSRPEDWIEGSLGSFNSWNQSELTGPYLKPALEALPQIKQERKIFFALAWLNAFIGGHHSPEAQKVVYDYLATAHIDPDLRLKILQVVDELDRTVKIRGKYR